MIGQYQGFNAFYTCLFNFYIDFGYFGIYFFEFIYGVILGLLVEFYLKNKNLFMGVLLNINLSFAIFSEFRWYYQSIENIFLLMLNIILIIFMEKKEKNKNENNVVM